MGFGEGGLGEAEIETLKRKFWRAQMQKVWGRMQIVDGIYETLLETSDEVPDVDVTDHVYLFLWQGERALAVKHNESDQVWRLPTLEFDPELRDATDVSLDDPEKNAKKLERKIRPLLKERWAAQLGDWFQHSRLHLVANKDQDEVAPGTTRFRVLLLGELKKLGEVDRDNPWSRRLFPVREINQVLDAHQDLEPWFRGSIDAWLIRQSQAQSS